METGTIKSWRKKQKLTQPEAGEVLGYNWRTLARWERGKPAPPPEIMLELHQKTKGEIDTFPIPDKGGEIFMLVDGTIQAEAA